MGEVKKNILNQALLNPITVYSGGVPVAGFAADKLAEAVAKAGELASASNWVEVRLGPGTYDLADKLLLPSYCSLIGGPGVTIGLSGADDPTTEGLVRAQSHTVIRDIHFDRTNHDSAISLILEDDLCENVEIRGCSMSAIADGSGTMITTSSVYPTGTVRDILIIDNEFKGAQPILIYESNVIRVQIIGNRQDEIIASSQDSCSGVVEMGAVGNGGVCYGNVFRQNRIRLLMKRTSKDPNMAPYIMNFPGWGADITDNVVEYNVQHVTPGAAGAAQLVRFLSLLNMDATVPTAELHIKASVVSGNTFIIRERGNSTSTNTTVAAVEITEEATDVALGPVIFTNNLFLHETDKTGLTKQRIKASQTFAGGNGVMTVQPNGFRGFDTATDNLTRVSVDDLSTPVASILRKRVAVADITETGYLLVSVPSDRQFLLADVFLMAQGGVPADATSIDVKCGSNVLYTVAPASLGDDQRVGTGFMDGATLLANGEGFQPQTAGADVVLCRVGDAITGATHVDVTMIYTLL